MIGFVGLSHLGIVSSIATAARGFGVLAYDPDAALVDDLNQGHLPIFEPGLQDLLAESWPRLRFTADPADLHRCELLFLSLDTPTDQDDRADVTAFDALLNETVAHAVSGATLVILSQVPPGSTRRWAERLADVRPDLRLFYQVETLILGSAVQRALRPERFIVGCADPQDELPGPYVMLLQAFGCPVFRMRYGSAELAKIAVNVHLAAAVSVTNTLAELCEAVGADWNEIAPTLKLDRRIGPHAYLSPGLGIAGGNLERDLAAVQALAHELGTEAGVVDAFLTNSRHRRDWTLRTLHAELDGASVVALWGLAYKPDTASTKNSPALQLIRDLVPATVRAYDPRAELGPREYPNLFRTRSALDACRGADALAVLTPWSEFAAVALAEVKQLMSGNLIVDPFGVLDADQCDLLGFSYRRLGKPTSPARSASKGVPC